MSLLKNVDIFIKYCRYKKFSENEALKWVNEKYKNTRIDIKTKSIIEKYCKEDKPEVNFALRNNKISNNILSQIKILDKFLGKHILDTNILVFRMLDFNPFLNCRCFKEKGYMSTSLVNGDICAIHRHNIRLKIFVPKGTNGFYVDFISCRCGEYEFLLPRNTTINYLRQYKSKDGKVEIECFIDN